MTLPHLTILESDFSFLEHQAKPKKIQLPSNTTLASNNSFFPKIFSPKVTQLGSTFSSINTIKLRYITEWETKWLLLFFSKREREKQTDRQIDR